MSKSKKEILIEERLKMLREDPFGWEDKGPYYEKYDEQTRFIIRKPKPTYFKPLKNEVEPNSRF
jgi:hypothetical protein